MTVTTVGTLVVIGLAAVLSPILSELTGKLAVPDVVIEIVLGIIIGPAVLAIAHHWLNFRKRAPRRRVGRIARKEFGAVLSRHSGRL